MYLVLALDVSGCTNNRVLLHQSSKAN